MESDCLLTHQQVGEEAPAASSRDAFFLVQRTSVPVEFVTSVSPLERPYKLWYKEGPLHERYVPVVSSCIAVSSETTSGFAGGGYRSIQSKLSYLPSPYRRY